MGTGRNKDLIAKRDEQLLRRYHHLTEVERMRFDDALTVLSEQEFFISEERIMIIIRENCHKLKDINVNPVPKVRMPRITKNTLQLLQEKNGC